MFCLWSGSIGLRPQVQVKICLGLPDMRTWTLNLGLVQVWTQVQRSKDQTAVSLAPSDLINFKMIIAQVQTAC